MATCHSTAYAFSASGAIGPDVSSFVILSGLTFVETGGTDAGTIELHDQGKAAGKLLATFSVATGTGRDDASLPDIRCDGQVYVKVVSGTVSGAVTIR